MTLGDRRDADVGDLAEPDEARVGRLDQQVLDAAQALAVLGRAPDDDLEDLLLLEQVADLDARQQRGGGPPDVAGLEADRGRLVEVDLDLDGRLADGRGDDGRLDATDTRRSPSRTSSALACERRQVLAVDPDGDVALVAAPKTSATRSAGYVVTDRPRPG